MNEKGFAELVVIGLVGAVFVGGAITAVASDGSKPGDALYKIDRNVESARAMLVYTNEGRIKLELKQATERLQELKAIQTSKAAPKNIVEAVKNYQVAAEDYALSIDSAADKLAEIADAGKEINQSLADTVTQTSQEQLDVLASVHANLPPEAKEPVEKAMGSSEESINKALDSLKGKVSDDQRQQIINKLENSKDLRATILEKQQQAFDKIEAAKQQAIKEGDTTQQQIYQNVQTIIVEGQGQSSSSPGQPGSTSPGSTSTTPGTSISSSATTKANEKAKAKLEKLLAEIQAKKKEAADKGETQKQAAYQKAEDNLKQTLAKYQ